MKKDLKNWLLGKFDNGSKMWLWWENKMNSQVTQLKTQCESLLEKHEEDIEDWYFEKQDEVESTLLSKTSSPWIKFQVSFEEYVCRERALKKGEDSCLGEKLQKLKKKKKSKKEKGETGSKTELWLIVQDPFCTLLFHITLINYLHQPIFSSAVNFRRNQDGDGPGGEGLPCPRPVALLSPGGAEGSGPALASRVSG